jgi:hypothetical protein
LNLSRILQVTSHQFASICQPAKYFVRLKVILPNGLTIVRRQEMLFQRKVQPAAPSQAAAAEEAPIDESYADAEELIPY